MRVKKCHWPLLTKSNGEPFHEDETVVQARQEANEQDVAFKIEIVNAVSGERMGTDLIQATESPFRLDNAVGLAIGLKFWTLMVIWTAASGDGETIRSLEGLMVTANPDPDTVKQLKVLKKGKFINEIADREQSLGVRKWRTEFRSLVGEGGWETPALTWLPETVQEYLNVVLLQFWVNRWRHALPYTKTHQHFETRMLDGVEGVLGRVLALHAPRWKKKHVFQPRQRWKISLWRAMWVLLEFRCLNAARLDDLICWLDQERNRYHCFVR